MARSDAFRKVNDSTHPSPKNDAEIHTQTVYSLSDQTRMIISGRMGLAQKTLLRDAAGVFEMSERTYKRNLADEGTRFSQIVEEVRMSEAKRLLVGTHISITEIAQVLGYAHLPSFNRAFRRASGQTPSEHRSRAQ
jgi:AraC-like DNA-binding protein